MDSHELKLKQLIEALVEKELASQSKTEIPKLIANVGDMAEGWLGAAITARFLNPEKQLTPRDVYSVIRQLNQNKNISKTKNIIKSKTFSRPGNPEIKKSQPDIIQLTIGLNASGFEGFSNVVTFETNEALIQSCIKFASSARILDYSNKVWNDPKQNIIEVLSIGTEDQKGTKVDLKIMIDGKPVPWGLISLKAGGTKQLGQIGMGWASDPANKKYSRGIFDLFKSLFGVEIDPSLKEPYEKALGSGKYSKIVAAIENIYDNAYKKIANRFSGDEKELLDFLVTFAKGVRYEALLEEEGVVLVHLSPGEFKVMDFNQLLEFVKKEDVEVEVEYIPATGGGKVPYLFINMKVNGQDFGHLIDIRPKIRIDEETGKIKEFRHYVEKEPGLVRLLSITQ